MMVCYIVTYIFFLIIIFLINLVTPGLVDELRWVTLVPLTDAECTLAFGSAVSSNLLCAEGNYNQGICTVSNFFFWIVVFSKIFF